MSVVKEVRGPAVTAWCPVKRPREAVIAMGSMDNSSNVLQLYGMDLSLPGREMSLRGSVQTSSSVRALSWSNVLKHQTTCSMGVIAGAMEDGTVSLWDANKVMYNDGSLLGTVTKHKGAVNTVQFNPRQDSSHLIASGGADGEVYITSIAKLNKPAIFAPGPSIAQPGNEITTIAWNNQAAFIVASGCQQGTTTIWDLKQKQPWCQLHDPNRAPVSAIAWSPHEGLQVITASNDDNHPVVRLWDLRGSRTAPLAEFSEHHAGILSVAWCPHDAGYVLTSARDNRTLLWDVNSNQLAFEVYDQQDDGSYYGFQRSYLQWSPHQPGIFSASAPDRTQVVGINGIGSQALYSPEWVAQVTKAYEQPGGQNLSMSNEANQAAAPLTDSPIALIDGADTLEQRGGDGDAYCEYKTHQDPSDVEWGFLKILFSEDARKQLLLHLGFDEDQIAVEASRYMGDSSPVQSDPSLAEDPLPVFTKQSEEIIKRSLLVGNFEAAVECCLRHNQLANALLLATCGGPELWHRTQEAFFKQQQRPFMKIVAAIIKNELATLSDLTRWKETLAILSTYSKSEEFPSLCDQLAVRLYNSGDVASAALCFICAMNMDRAISIWIDRANSVAQSQRPLAVLNAIEKITVFGQATGQLSNSALPLYSEYAYLMLSIGQFDIAAKYGKHDPNIMEQLRQGSAPQQHQEPRVVSHEAYNHYAQSPRGEVMQQFVPQQHNVHHYEHTKSPKKESLNYDTAANEANVMTYEQQAPQESYGDFPVDGGHNVYEHGYNAYDQPNSQEPVYQSDFEHVQPPSNEFDMSAQANVYPTRDDPYQNDLNAPHDGPPAHAFGDDIMQPHAQQHEEFQQTPMAPPSSELRVDTSAPPLSNDTPGSDLQTPSPIPNATPKQVLLNPVRTKPQAAPKTPPAPVAAPAQPYVTSVDLSSVSEDDMAIVRAVSDIIGVLEVQKLPAMEAKQLGDIKKSSDILFTKLNSGELGDVVLDLVHDMAGALAARDIKHAQQVHVILTKDHWTKQKDWLKGLKALIQISVKRIR